TESICRNQADELKVSHIVIRRGVHDSRTWIGKNGTPYWCKPKGSKCYRKAQRASDWHITVWAGNGVDQLLLGGHIYVDFDGEIWDGAINKVTDPETQRWRGVEKYGDKKVADEWWCL
ncbi:hypothetical protein B0T20DRAFT_321917, partial [Sordaria brevicollis]